LWLGSTAMPIERKQPGLFTLPIARWEIMTGKLIGTQFVIAAYLAAGYLIAALFAVRNDLPIDPYSRFALAAAFCASFAVLCIGIPLGTVIHSFLAGFFTVQVLTWGANVESLVSRRVLEGGWLSQAIAYLSPFRISSEPLRYAFWGMYNLRAVGGEVFIDYPGLAWNALYAVLFFFVFAWLFRRTELVIK
jgi:ABC-type transport system involved in multi-copper enzyme maturation permease subunit